MQALEEDAQMKERLSGYHIKYLKFPVVTLGKIPPRITGVKVHKSVHRDEIIIDVGVQYSGDLCIQVNWKKSILYWAYSYQQKSQKNSGNFCQILGF